MKHGIRKELLQKRLSHRFIEEHSRRIAEKVFSFDLFRQSDRVLFYMAVRNEVDTMPLVQGSGKDILLPVTRNRRIIVSRVHNINKLVRGAYSVPEPEDVEEIQNEQIDLVIVPGIGFDRSGARIGYGKGYYDRMLATTSAPKIGLAYSFQVVERLPTEEHDVRMDYIITEQEVIKCD